MATLRIDIPDGHFCEKCSFLVKPNQRDGGTMLCKIFDCVLGNRLTNIFKCPMCIEQSQKYTMYRNRTEPQ